MSTADNALKSTNKQVMRVYAAKTYKTYLGNKMKRLGNFPQLFILQ